ncbi:hypothetical protein FRC07_001318 [Ceratobasidium sp. 392]|nr:hypothetical protein FRC07_001318 [Ceratobasidium sp. 392]
MQAFTDGLRGVAASYSAMPGGFDAERRVVTYAELFNYIVEQERDAYAERIKSWATTANLHQNPQLWMSLTMGEIMDQPVEL